jgi:hypothetical protein
MNHVSKNSLFVNRSILVLLLMLCAVSAQADWSVPVLLWEDQPGGSQLATVDAAIAVDAEENVHVVFTHGFVHPDHWEYGRMTQLSYAKFDAWGHLLVPETMLSDSVATCSYPKIGLFGMDSLWVVWMNTGDWEHEPHCLKIRPLSLEGQPMDPSRCWTDSVWRGPLGYAFQILPDRSTVLAFSDAGDIVKTILMIHQRPDGTRILDHVPIFRNPVNGEATDQVHGYADMQRDSLQIIWREAHLSDWVAVYCKRASLQAPPVDPANLGNHVALTPPTPGYVRGPGEIKPIGDSLIAFADLRPTEYCLDDAYLHILRWTDYSEISNRWIGCENLHEWDIEPNGHSMSLVSNDDSTHNSALHFTRFSLPFLTVIEDTILARNIYGQNIDYSMAYTVSPCGARILVYERSVGPQYNSRQLYYRIWRSDLAASPHSTPLPTRFALYQSYPNPFNPQTEIKFDLPQQTRVELKIFNTLGRLITTLVDDIRPAGSYTVAWDGKNNASGMYIYQLQAGNFTDSKKMMLIK